MTELFPVAPPSRRTVIGAALWSVPVITLATAAPAFAASGELTLEFTAGQTAAGNNPTVLSFRDASVLVSGTATSSAQLRMAVTFEPIRTGDSVELVGWPTPSDWEAEEEWGDTFTAVYAMPVKTGDVVSINDFAIAHMGGPERGTFHVSFELAGYSSRPTASFPITPV